MSNAGRRIRANVSDDDVRRAMLRKAKKDFAYFCKQFVWITDKRGQLVRLTPNRAQQAFIELVTQLRSEGRPVRVIIEKGRQQGLSTVCQAYIAWRAFAWPGHQALTIAHEEKASANLFGKCEFTFRHLPPWWREPLEQARIGRTRGQEMRFGGQLNTFLHVATAGSPDAVRSYTFQHVHASEVAFWKKDVHDIMSGLLASIPLEAETSVFVESTANGMGDWFHSQWSRACDPEEHSAFVPLFVPWYWQEEYARPRRAADAPLTPSEKKVRERVARGYEILGRHYSFELSDEQLLWRRDVIASYDGDETRFRREYPCDPVEGFLVSGRPFFDPETLERLGNEAEKPVRRGDIRIEEVDGVPKKAVFEPHSLGPFCLWELPQKDASYVVAADIASGGGRDSTCIQVLRVHPPDIHTRLEQVACWHGKTDLVRASQLCWALARLFNDALLAPERNGIGEGVIAQLVKFGYRRLYQQEAWDQVMQKESVRYGWSTTNANRPGMLDAFGGAVRNRVLRLRDSRTVGECQSLVFTDELGRKAEANPGANDDAVLALAIAVVASERVSTRRTKATRAKRAPIL